MTSDRWVEIAPVVAVELWGPPSRKAEREMRWGRKGSKSMKTDKGRWFDFENDCGGGVIDLVESELQTDRRGAVEWLRSKGLIPESSPGRDMERFNGRSGTRHVAGRDRKSRLPKPKDAGTFRFTQILWSESEEIGDNPNHPFWRWATVGDKIGVLHPYCTIPGGIRWHTYRGGVIVAGVFPIEAWGNDGIPSGEPVAVQALAIDLNGENRFVLGKNRDLRRCSYGPVSAGTFLLGSPKSERVNVVEGVADALAVYSRAPGAVLATLGTPAKLVNQADVIEWLIKREVWLYPDNDENKAGDKGTMALAESVKNKSPGARVFAIDTEAFEDPGDWAARTPFPEIERYDFDEKSGTLYDSGLPWGEADRTAIQLLMKGNLQ